MQARIDYQCQPREEDAPYECEDISIVVDLPFVPAVGTMLKLTVEGDYIEVADVMLDLSPEGEGLIVGLKEPEDWQLRSWPEMQAQGWRIREE